MFVQQDLIESTVVQIENIFHCILHLLASDVSMHFKQHNVLGPNFISFIQLTSSILKC